MKKRKQDFANTYNQFQCRHFKTRYITQYDNFW